MVAENRPQRSALRRVASFVGWIWGSSSIFLGLLMLGIGPEPFIRVFGLSAVLAGTLLLPPAGRWISRRVTFFEMLGVPLLSSVVVGVTILVANPYPTPETSDRPSNQAVSSQAGGGAEEPSDIGSSEVEAEASERHRRVETEIQAMWAELTRVTQPCDVAAERASVALHPSRRDLVAAYSVVREAKDVCARAGLDAMGIDAPQSLSRSQRRAFEEAINECGLAYAGKSVLFDRTLRVIDGDVRPSQLAAVQEAGRASQAQVVRCVVRISTLAQEQGVELTDPTND